VQEDLLTSRKAKVESAIGIRHVIDLLASERKLIVGHSCFLGTIFFLPADTTSIRSNFAVVTPDEVPPYTEMLISNHGSYLPYVLGI
jgi:hypothetical protein